MGLSMLKGILAVAGVLAFVGGPAIAAECKKDLAEVDAALAKVTSVHAESSGVAARDIKRAQEFREKGAKACDAGDLEAGRFALDQAKSILGIKTFF